MSTLEKLYGVIIKVYKVMNRSFDIPLENIGNDSLLREELGLDSLSFVMIILEIEKEFEITLSVEGMSACRSVGDVISIVEKEINK